MARTKRTNVYKMTYKSPANSQQISVPHLYSLSVTMALRTVQPDLLGFGGVQGWKDAFFKQRKKSLCQYANQY